ncbi:hypothetical protein [Phascolarctobacterium sp.]|uniref:hypothetical protein n=1 Tax=Phascolarctobacterium sp. TaxID=2049039 RepID=UPI002A815367|nr:hypothetical protein [Phascolarctobacterium sp.]MDY5045939.1 hypothetical protein [Phascolarctobacterium sp.]
MNYEEILAEATRALAALNTNLIPVLELHRPTSIQYAVQLAKVISKLSPLLGNMIEFSTIDVLNRQNWNNQGIWVRQDPGFPDALFQSNTIIPNPGIEIKAWFPFATEITARFKDSIRIFEHDNINVALIAWLPEHVIWGEPQIIDVLVVSGRSIAEARDNHYHNPPDYIVFEPENTEDRTVNLQQTNTNGYKIQGTRAQQNQAIEIVNSWGVNGRVYSPSPEYQAQLRTLLGQFTYRLDTNYAKIDRIEHVEIEAFKSRVLNTQFNGRTIRQWSRILSSNNQQLLEDALRPLI